MDIPFYTCYNVYCHKLIKFAVLDGEVAEPCNPQSAIAGLNSCLRYVACRVWPE